MTVVTRCRYCTTRAFPNVSPGDFARIEHEANAKTITAIPQVVHSAVSPSPYAYTRQTTRRNLYRIQLSY